MSREHLREIAEKTLSALTAKRIVVQHLVYDIGPSINQSTLNTAYYAPDSLLSTWEQSSPALPPPSQPKTTIEFLETTTLAAARAAGANGRKKPIGVLNFASAGAPPP